MPAASVDGGDTAVTQLGNELTDLRDALVRGRDELDADPFAGVTVSDAMREGRNRT